MDVNIFAEETALMSVEAVLPRAELGLLINVGEAEEVMDLSCMLDVLNGPAI